MLLTRAGDGARAPARAVPQRPGRAARQGSPSGTRATPAPPTSSIPRTSSPSGGARAQGYEVAVIYHSHIDAGAYFSATDKQNALMDGEPPTPTATYVVVSVMGGVVADRRPSSGEPAARDFVPTRLPRPLTDMSELRRAVRGGPARDPRRRQQPGARVPRRRRHARSSWSAPRARASSTSTAARTSTSSARGAR